MISKITAVEIVVIAIVAISAFIVPHAASYSESPAPPEPEPSILMLPEVATTTGGAEPFEYRSYESEVRDFFSDIPVMIDIARCESMFYQFEPDGTPLKNKQGSSARGVFQIMLSWHDSDALAMGFDVETLEGNLGYARWLYSVAGVSPWEASADCWRI